MREVVLFRAERANGCVQRLAGHVSSAVEDTVCSSTTGSRWGQLTLTLMTVMVLRPRYSADWLLMEAHVEAFAAVAEAAARCAANIAVLAPLGECWAGMGGQGVATGP
jgi:hypothetical protein